MTLTSPLNGKFHSTVPLTLPKAKYELILHREMKTDLSHCDPKRNEFSFSSLDTLRHFFHITKKRNELH